MAGRRAWLQQLLVDELARAQRSARGHTSALEAACGIAPPAQPVSPAALAYSVAGVMLKVCTRH
jgi:hypothetical protein